MAQDMKTVYTVVGAEVRSVGPLVGRLFFFLRDIEGWVWIGDKAQA